jgi:hypothetical protein
MSNGGIYRDNQVKRLDDCGGVAEVLNETHWIKWAQFRWQVVNLFFSYCTFFAG